MEDFLQINGFIYLANIIYYSYTGSSFGDIITAHENNDTSVMCTTTGVSDGVVTVNTISGRWYAVTVTTHNNRTLNSSYTQYIQINPAFDLKIV